jgi:3-oxoacyl-[acyl-carrier-protein] synthase III
MDTTPQWSVAPAFFERPTVQTETLPVGPGIPDVPLGIEQVSNPALGIGGAYGAWGQPYDNGALPALVEERLGGALPENEKLNLAELGFVQRHHAHGLSAAENRELEIEAGARFLRAAAHACGWEPGEVEGVFVGVSAPLGVDYAGQVAERAGIPDEALKVSVHKACDSSVGGLHLALNPALPENRKLSRNLAEVLYGKKVLVAGIEGLSRFVEPSGDSNALQLFGNAAGAIGVIPGETMKFIAGKTHEVYDEEGVLQARMLYPHATQPGSAASLVEVSEVTPRLIRVAGRMHEPVDGANIKMAGPMGMVKLFVRTGVQVVQDVYRAYQARLEEMGQSGKTIAATIVHHANFKINKLIEKNLLKEGISLPMPWLLSEFGNVSAASNMIAFLRQLPFLKPGDHVLVDGFGAGTYYDALVVELGASTA